jgi:hypothetical protein
MKYMLVIHQGAAPTPRSPDEWASLSEDEQKAVYADYQAINETPEVAAGLQLDSSETATTVRVQDGRTLTTDGPFVETKEALGGYLRFEAEDLDPAIARPLRRAFPPHRLAGRRAEPGRRGRRGAGSRGGARHRRSPRPRGLPLPALDAGRPAAAPRSQCRGPRRLPACADAGPRRRRAALARAAAGRARHGYRPGPAMT